MNYANILTGELADSLPTVIITPAGVTHSPTFGQAASIGWRVVVSTEEPQTGYRVLRYAVTDTDGSNCNLVIAEQESIAGAEQARQDSKSAGLKQLENAYCAFLETSWTNLLRSKGLIEADYVITVENTDSATNTVYLLSLMQSDMALYTPMAAVFLGFKSAIEGVGGTLSDCRKHI